MSPTPKPPDSRECEVVVDLLSWHANGTFGAADRATVDSHIEVCDACRATLAVERRLVEAMREPRDNVEQSPHAGWQKLAARLDAEDSTQTLDEAIAQQRVTSRRESATAAASVRRARAVNWPAALGAAVAVQAAAIAVLAVALVRHRQAEEAPRYHTVSNADPTLAATGPLVRIAFDSTVDDTAARGIADGESARILAGPSPDNVYTFEFQEGADSRTGAGPESERATPAGARASRRACRRRRTAQGKVSGTCFGWQRVG